MFNIILKYQMTRGTLWNSDLSKLRSMSHIYRILIGEEFPRMMNMGTYVFMYFVFMY